VLTALTDDEAARVTRAVELLSQALHTAGTGTLACNTLYITPTYSFQCFSQSAIAFLIQNRCLHPLTIHPLPFKTPIQFHISQQTIAGGRATRSFTSRPRTLSSPRSPPPPPQCLQIFLQIFPPRHHRQILLPRVQIFPRTDTRPPLLPRARTLRCGACARAPRPECCTARSGSGKP
jgi:hypothetical protein